MTLARVFRRPVALATSALGLWFLFAPAVPLRAAELDMRDAVTDRAFWAEVRELAELSNADEPAPAVCWLNEGSTNISYDTGNFTTYETRRVKIVILDAKRAEGYANVAIACSKRVPISKLKARTVTRSGKWVDVKKDDIHERSRFPDFVLYADVREKVFAMPSFADSCVIEYEYTRSHGDTQFEDEFRFDMSIPVRKAEYTFAMPKDLLLLGVDIATRSSGAPRSPVKGARPAPGGGLTGTQSTLTWTCASLPAIPREPFRAPLADLCSRVTVGLASMRPEYPQYTWRSFGDDYFKETISPLLAEGRALAGEVRSFLRNPKDELETIEMVANGVAENVRYVAIEIDGSGWKPRSPKEVLASRYGDCKDMSVLTAALLRVLGIEAWPALVRTRDDGTIDGSIVTPSLMNHMIVYVRSGGEEHWIDPAGGVLELGELPSVDRDVQALVLSDAGCSFVRTPRSTAEANRIAWTVNAEINAGGSIVGEATAHFTGDLALEMRNTIRGSSREDVRKALERMVAGQFAGAHVTSWERVERSGKRGCLVRMAFEADWAGASSGGRAVLDGSFFGIAGPEETLPAGRRHHGVVFDRPYAVADSCCIRLSDGWAPDGLPGDLSERAKYGFYARRFSHADGVIRCSRTFELTAKAVAASEYGDLRAFWLDASRAHREPVLLVRG